MKPKDIDDCKVMSNDKVGLIGPEVIEFMNDLRLYKNKYTYVEYDKTTKWHHFVIKKICIETDMITIPLKKELLMGCNVEMTMFKNEDDEERLEITIHLL